MPHGTLHIDEAVDRMGDRELYLEIAHFFAGAIPASKGNLENLLRAANWVEARRLAHSLKSNCAAVGADDLRGIAYKLETACRDGDGAAASAAFKDLCVRLDSLREALLALH